MPDLSPDLNAQFIDGMGKLIQEQQYGPGSYVLIIVADAGPGETIVQYDWWWRPAQASPPDIVDRFRADPG